MKSCRSAAGGGALPPAGARPGRSRPGRPSQAPAAAAAFSSAIGELPRRVRHRPAAWHATDDLATSTRARWRARSRQVSRRQVAAELTKTTGSKTAGTHRQGGRARRARRRNKTVTSHDSIGKLCRRFSTASTATSTPASIGCSRCCASSRFRPIRPMRRNAEARPSTSPPICAASASRPACVRPGGIRS